MSWALVDRRTLHHQILQERQKRDLQRKELIKKKIDETLAKAKAGGKLKAQVVLGASLVCDEADCGFSSDISRCWVCSSPQSWAYMRKWYTFHAKRLSRHFWPVKIEFQSCSYPSVKGQLVKGRYTLGLFFVYVASKSADSFNGRRSDVEEDGENGEKDDEEDEDKWIPPLDGLTKPMVYSFKESHPSTVGPCTFCCIS